MSACSFEGLEFRGPGASVVSDLRAMDLIISYGTDDQLKIIPRILRSFGWLSHSSQWLLKY